MTDILLVAVNAKYMHPSLSLRYLMANLGPLEERTEIREYTLRNPIDEPLRDILDSSARVLAFSLYIWNHAFVRALLESLREAYRERRDTGDGRKPPLVVLGGPEASYLPEDAPVLRLADVVVRGEGEAAFRRIVRDALTEDAEIARPERPGEPLEGAPVCGREPTAEVAGAWSPDRPPRFVEGGCVDLGTVEPAYRLYTDRDLEHRRFVYVEMSRGCPYGCEFCLSSLDTELRYFDEERFFREMTELFRRGARRIKMLDRTFNADQRRAVRIARFFLDRLPEDGFIHFEVVPDRFSEPLKDALAAFPPGKLRLEVGIQTFNPEVAARIGRRLDVETTIANLAWLKSGTKAIVHADLIAGLPGEDMESFARGFDLLWEHRPGEIQLGLLKKLPGVPIARHDEAWGMEYQTEPPYRVLSTSVMSRDEIEELHRFARFWELVVNRGRFDDEIPRLLPDGRSAFSRFHEFSRAAYERFGRAHAIELRDLRDFVASFLSGGG